MVGLSVGYLKCWAFSNKENVITHYKTYARAKKKKKKKKKRRKKKMKERKKRKSPVEFDFKSWKTFRYEAYEY